MGVSAGPEGPVFRRGRAAHLRRGDDGLPRRARWRARAVRRHARSHDAGQGDRRRHAGGRLRRSPRSDATDLPLRPRVPGRDDVGASGGDGSGPRDARDHRAGPRLLRGPRDARRSPRAGRERRHRHDRRALPACPRGLDVDALLHGPSGDGLDDRGDGGPRAVRSIPPRDAVPRHLAGAIAVRGQLHLGGAHGGGHRRDRRCDCGRARGDPWL